MATRKTGVKKGEEMTFASMEDRVREILDKLGEDTTGLDEQIALGEEGVKLLDAMNDRLEELRKRVEGISKVTASEDQKQCSGR